MTRLPIFVPRAAAGVENEVRGEGQASILLPESVLAQTRYRCRVVVDRDGTVCGRPFFEGQRRQFELHAARCATEHADEIRAYLSRRHPDVMRPWDVEFGDWVRQHSRGILEGRVKM